MEESSRVCFSSFVKSHLCWCGPSSSAFQRVICACQEIIPGLSIAMRELGVPYSLFFCTGTKLGGSLPGAPAPCLLGQRGLWMATAVLLEVRVMGLLTILCSSSLILDCSRLVCACEAHNHIYTHAHLYIHVHFYWTLAQTCTPLFTTLQI